MCKMLSQVMFVFCSLFYGAYASVISCDWNQSKNELEKQVVLVKLDVPVIHENIKKYLSKKINKNFDIFIVRKSKQEYKYYKISGILFRRIVVLFEDSLVVNIFMSDEMEYEGDEKAKDGFESLYNVIKGGGQCDSYEEVLLKDNSNGGNVFSEEAIIRHEKCSGDDIIEVQASMGRLYSPKFIQYIVVQSSNEFVERMSKSEHYKVPQELKNIVTPDLLFSHNVTSYYLSKYAGGKDEKKKKD